MFKVWITRPGDSEPFSSEEFISESHLDSWIVTEEARTGYIYTKEDITTQHQLELAQKAARKLLADTDWYCSRLIETQVEIPQEIKDQRAAARLLL